MAVEREVLEVDVLFVGAGPAGLAGALHLQRKLAEHNALARETGGRTLDDPMVAVIEKADTIGAHTLSGAVVDPRALDELLPDWRETGAPLVPVVKDSCCCSRRPARCRCRTRRGWTTPASPPAR